MAKKSRSRLQAKSGLTLALAGVLAVAFLLAFAGAPARAADDEEEALDTKIFRNFMESIGLSRDSAGIEYRERSPLVVPPSRALPAPDKATAAENNPAWPVDPDVKRRKDATAADKRDARSTAELLHDNSRPLRPDELERGKVARGTGNRPANRSTTEYESQRKLMPSELGYKGGIFSNLFDRSKSEETGVFAGEPPRTNLTEPPAGYQTPSPNQPYGLGSKKQEAKPLDPKDKGLGR